MLVVTRKVGEQIQIGHGITLTVVRVAGGTVRIGVEAPKDVSVVRDDVRVEAGDADEPESHVATEP